VGGNMRCKVGVAMQPHQRFLDGEMDTDIVVEFDQCEMYGRPFVFRADRKIETVDHLEQGLVLFVDFSIPVNNLSDQPLATR
jgi:hypothetical protein